VRKPKVKMFWWYRHLGNMIASYIAAWTAFPMTTLPLYFGNHVGLWLWPTATGDCGDHYLPTVGSSPRSSVRPPPDRERLPIR